MNVKITKRFVVTLQVEIPAAEVKDILADLDGERWSADVAHAANDVFAQHYTHARVACRPEGPFWMENVK